MTNYNWRTDEDVDWEATETIDSEQPKRRKRWPIFVAILLALGVAAGLVVRQAQERADDASEAIEQDVLGSAALISRAFAEQDRELFVALLSGSNEEWTDAQLELFEIGELYDRQAFGLVWEGFIPEETSPVQLEASLRSATFEQASRYSQPQADGSKVELQLKTPQIYRIGQQNSWLLSPPLEEYWGPEESYVGTQLQFRFPQKDSAWFNEFARLADASVTQICEAHVHLDCQDASIFTVQISKDITSLISAQSGSQLLEASGGVMLPAVSLIGLPLNENSNALLQQAYLRKIVLGFLADRFNYECCERAIFLQAMADFLLAEQANGTYPRSQETYDQFLNELIDIRFDSSRRLGGLDFYWQEDEWEYPYALIDYIFNTEEDPTTLRITNEILNGAIGVDWLLELFELTVNDRQLLDVSWYRFLAKNRSNEIGTFAEREAQLLCTETGSDFYRRYRLLANAPGLELIDDPAIGYRGRVIPLGDNTGVVVPNGSGNGMDHLEVRFFDGRVLQLAPHPDNSRLQVYTGLYSPDYSKLLTFSAMNVATGLSAEQSYFIYDLSDCPNNICQPTPVGGYGNWSPDSKHYAYFAQPEISSRDLVISDGLGQNPQHVPIAGSTAVSVPDWQDSSHLLLSRGEQIVSYDINTGVDVEILNFDTIRSSGALGELDSSEFIFLTQLATLQGYDRQYLISGQFSSNGRRQESFLLRYDEVTGGLEKVVSLESGWILPLGNSFESDWLTVFQFAINSRFELSNRAEVTMYNYRTEMTFDFVLDTNASILVQPVAVYENWLLVPGDGFIRLIDAAAGKQHYTFPEQNLICSAAFWMENE